MRYHIMLSIISLISVGACNSFKLARQERQYLKRVNDTMQTAYWVEMMEDSNCTYNATVSAFELYWKNREKPIEEDINEGRNIFEEDSVEYATKKDLSLVWEYKCFLNWKAENKYLVKPDGRVLTSYEIIQMWRQNQKDSVNKK